MKKIIKNITILRPGGNDTALVPGLNWTKIEMKLINDRIMNLYKNVEQVGFIDLKKPELQMAGGEFCGNATRSAAYLALKGKLGEINIKVSGVNKTLKAGIDLQGNTWSQMPIYEDSKLIKQNKKYSVVPLVGITLVVINRKNKFINQEIAKKEALIILKKLKLLNSVTASGVMFIYKKKGQLNIEPVVWVRDIKTFFYETACASGTTAVGIFEAIGTGKNVNSLPVIQPSGSILNVSIRWDKNKFSSAYITGQIEILDEDIDIEMEVQNGKK